jgi:large subunit ribosomal protein L3
MGKLGNFSHLKEFRLMSGELKRGDKIDVSTFEVGDNVKVTGVSKGKGFQGVVKRYGFKGTKATHGNKDQLRMPGSIGATGPAHVFKGQRMPGRMGDEIVTVTNLKVIEINKDNNTILVKGAVPGARNGLLLIQGEGELKLASQETADDSKQTAEKMPEDIKKDTKEDQEVKDVVKEEKPEEKEKNIEEVVVEAAEKVKDKEPNSVKGAKKGQGKEQIKTEGAEKKEDKK